MILSERLRLTFSERLRHHDASQVAHGQGQEEPEEHGRYVEALMHLTERTGMRGSEVGTLSDDTLSIQSFRDASLLSRSGLVGMRSMSSDGGSSIVTTSTSAIPATSSTDAAHANSHVKLSPSPPARLAAKDQQLQEAAEAAMRIKEAEAAAAAKAEAEAAAARAAKLAAKG